MARMRIGNAEVWGRVTSSTLGIGGRAYDICTLYLPLYLLGRKQVPEEAPRLIGQVYRAPGGVHAVSHWRNTRTEAGYRTKWAAMLYLYEAWLDGRDVIDAFYEREP